MATLTRSRMELTSIPTAAATSTEETNTLDNNIPAPFPRERLVDIDDVQESPAERHVPSQTTSDAPTELMSSIGFVERSCLMTLNNLLSVPFEWRPIVPDRRHSMPSTPTPASTSAEVDSSSALHTLVSNLRTRDTDDKMVEVATSNEDAELLRELSNRVEGLSWSITPEDARLAKSLVSLLPHLHRLSAIYSSIRNDNQPRSSTPIPTSISANIFDTLKRQLSDLKVDSIRAILPAGSSHVLAVETALLWSRIDEGLDQVVTLCKERTTSEHLPPRYDRAEYEFDSPPEYDYDAKSSPDDYKESSEDRPSSIPAQSMNEKMRLDFEAVTMAIDRLYLVAPQLHNQRVELKSSKLAQMEKARLEGSAVSRGKQKETDRDMRELENIFEMLDKATDRKMVDQSVVLDDGMKARYERARQRDEAKRKAFVDHLAEHSNHGRLHSQDAVPQQPKVRDPNAMLTLPEFIRESVPASMPVEDLNAMMTLPEFVREAPPAMGSSTSMPPISSSGGTFRRLAASSKKKSRDRSMSAPSPLSWLRHSHSRSALNDTSTRQSSRAVTPKVDFEVSYIAENHENLNHVLIFLSVTGVLPGVDIEAEVPPSIDASAGSDRLIIRNGSQTSHPLALPGRVLPGKKEISVQSGHFEIKLTTLPSSTLPQVAPLLDATQLSESKPTSFICASCSLPVVQSSKISQYDDLPSEHWQELVDAWMCHSDQKLHDQIMQSAGKGFWPQLGQALVGGSYILFEESSITKGNLHSSTSSKGDNDWQPVLCICGATVGRCQQGPADLGPCLVYRLLKYAIRPVSPTTEPFKVSLSAFIVEDMIEFVNAHASYRFVVLDEEDEKPRILMWLFKPSIQLAYTIGKSYAIPRSGNIQAAKVLFKLMGPNEPNDLRSILNKYPGFPQAEYLFYSMNVCRTIAGLLRESNGTYPENMRMMTGLEVGWLHRS